MKRVYVNEEWCLGCHLCEYNCAFANSAMTDMATALKGTPIYSRIHIEGNDKVSYAVSCRHCTEGKMYEKKTNNSLKRLFTKDGLLKGFILNDRTERAGIYTSLIREKTPLDTIDFETMKKVATSVAFSPEKHRKKFGGVVQYYVNKC